MIVLSGVRMRVDRRPMCITVSPVRSPKRHASPTSTGRVADHRESAEQIFDGLLRGESDGESADAQTCENGGDVVTPEMR